MVRESNRDYSIAWKRLNCHIIGSKVRELIYLMLHNKLPIPERLFRIKLQNDPYCQFCISAEIADVEHYFCSCSRVAEIWLWLRTKIVGMDNRLSIEDDWSLLNLCFPKTVYEKEFLWLISIYTQFVWDQTYVCEVAASLNAFFGYLTFKYPKYKMQSGMRLRGMEDFS